MTADPIVTLTTDFGEESPYVAAMKGVILGINPRARLVDLGHQIPPQDVRQAAFFLAAAIPYHPPEAIHVVVVDPEVGTQRALLYVEAQGHRLLVPDNGCWTTLAKAAPPRVIRLTEPRFWRQPVSDTFHGRDILAAVAGHLSLGVAPELLGQRAESWTRLETPEPRREKNRITGEVVSIDRFGNLITNIAAAMLPNRPEAVRIGGRLCRGIRWARTYAEAKPGSLLALISSTGLLEIAVVRGRAAHRLRARIGTPVVVGWKR